LCLGGIGTLGTLGNVEVCRADVAMVSGQVMFGEIITKICGSWPPVYHMSIALDLRCWTVLLVIPDAVELSVWIGVLAGCGWPILMSVVHSMHGIIAGIVVQACKFGFGGRWHDVLENVAHSVGSAIVGDCIGWW
jgi:hypothetical protein